MGFSLEDFFAKALIAREVVIRQSGSNCVYKRISSSYTRGDFASRHISLLKFVPVESVPMNDLSATVQEIGMTCIVLVLYIPTCKQ